jgi:hypothetical protein
MRNQMHDKASLAAALQLQLGLNPTEAQIAMRLATQGCVAREQICGIEVRGHRSVKAGSVGAIVRGLRRKLAGYGITVDSINGFGFELRQEDRAKVLELLGRPKPTNPIRTSPTRAAEPADAKSRRRGKMSPERQQTHPEAA